MTSDEDKFWGIMLMLIIIFARSCTHTILTFGMSSLNQTLNQTESERNINPNPIDELAVTSEFEPYEGFQAPPPTPRHRPRTPPRDELV